MARRVARVRPKPKLGITPALLILIGSLVVIWATTPSGGLLTPISKSVTISSVSPSEARSGETVTIRGTRFIPGTTEIYLDNFIIPYDAASSSSTRLNVTLPSTACKAPAQSGCKQIPLENEKPYKLFVKDRQGRKSNSITFTVKE